MSYDSRRMLRDDARRWMGRVLPRRGVLPVMDLVWVVSYLLLGYAWFDHGLGSPPPHLPYVGAAGFAVSLAWVLSKKGLPRLFGDRRDRKLFCAIFGLALASRLPLLSGAYGLFSSDAAVQGVMALHILEGKHHPIFLYRWSYVGSLKAHLTALLAWLSGEPVLSFAAAGMLMFALFAAAVFALARVMLPRRESVVAAAYVILAPGFLTVWGAHNEGSYIDVLAFGTAMLVLGARLLRDSERPLSRAFWMGVLGGLAFWAHILATYYLLAALLILVVWEWSRRIASRVVMFVMGFLIGDYPGFLWNVSHEWLSFRWWSVDQTETVDRLSRIATQLQGVVTTSLSVLAGWWPVDHPPWPGGFWRWALLFVFPVAFVTFGIRFRRSLSPLRGGRMTPEALIMGFALLVIAVFAQSSFGWMTEEPRYLLFLFSVLPLFVASALASLWRARRWAAGLIAALLVYVNLHGSVTYFTRALGSDGVNRRFVQELDRLGIRYGHTDYYISYKYNFLSHGRLVLTSALGPAQTEWYMPYREEVARAESVALIPRSYRFARRLGRRLAERGITYRREDLLYPVIFDLSENVRPEDLR